MAGTRYDLCVPKPGGQGKTFWLKIGAAWIDGDKLAIKLDAMPLGNIQDQNGQEKPFDGWVKAFVANADRGAGAPAGGSQNRSGTGPAAGGSRAQGGRTAGGGKDLDDDIPF